MITVSTAVATALEQPSRQIDVKLFNNSALDVDVMSLKMYKGACGQFTVGSVFVPYLEMTLNGDVDIDEFEVRVSVAVNGSFSTYYTVGWFKATSIEKKTDQTEVYAQGKLAFATEKITVSGTDVSLNQILTAVREYYTVDVKNLTIPSATIPTSFLPITDFTCRDALELIAVCSGGYVSETYNGHLVLGGFKNSTAAGTITEDRLTEQPVIKGEYELTGIDVKVSEAMTYHIPTESAVKNFEISNPYFNGDMAQIFSSNTIGHSFNVANVKVAMGDFRYEPFDLIEISRGSGLTPSNTLTPSESLYPSEGSSFTVPCYNITLTFDGGLQSEYNAEGELPTEKETKTGGAISSKLNEAYEKAIGANNLANAANERIDEIEEDGVPTVITKVQWAYGTSSQPVGAWGDEIPALTSTYSYLWTRIATVRRDPQTGEETITDYTTPQKSTLLNGVYTFVNHASNGDATVIDGGSIITGTLSASQIVVGSATMLDVELGSMNDDISDAQSTADSAQSTATSAQSTANTANTNANQAKTTANSAQSTANSAQSTANSAYSLAQSASGTADYYITTISGRTGICVHNYADYSNYCNINSSGLGVYVGGTLYSSFGSGTIELGKNNTSAYIYLCGNSGQISSYSGVGGLSIVPSGGELELYRSGSNLFRLADSGPEVPKLYVGGTTTVSGVVRPLTGSDSINLGTATYPWNNIYCKDSFVSTTKPTSGTKWGDAYWYHTSAGNYAIYGSSSGRQYKENIDVVCNTELDPRLLYKLPVRQFTWKERPEDGYDVGFIADEVFEHYPVASCFEINDDGEKKPRDWDSRIMIPAMLKLIQEQNDRLIRLEAEHEWNN